MKNLQINEFYKLLELSAASENVPNIFRSSTKNKIGKSER